MYFVLFSFGISGVLQVETSLPLSLRSWIEYELVINWIIIIFKL